MQNTLIRILAEAAQLPQLSIHRSQLGFLQRQLVLQVFQPIRAVTARPQVIPHIQEAPNLPFQREHLIPVLDPLVNILDAAKLLVLRERIEGGDAGIQGLRVVNNQKMQHVDALDAEGRILLGNRRQGAHN